MLFLFLDLQHDGAGRDLLSRYRVNRHDLACHWRSHAVLHFHRFHDRHILARLNPDGSLDAGFDAQFAAGANGRVSSVVVEDDGALLVGGAFGGVAGQRRYSVARILPDGTVDPAESTRDRSSRRTSGELSGDAPQESAGFGPTIGLPLLPQEGLEAHLGPLETE